MMANTDADTASAQPFVPANPALPSLRSAAAECTGCALYRTATQTVFGEGTNGAHLMLVGEQPGDQEDLQGRPFVGPAGKLLDRALAELGIDRAGIYLTNAVKHFKWRPAGSSERSRRLHQKPTLREIRACHPWLKAELEVVQPWVVVCLGATAARAVTGQDIRVNESRGELLRFKDLPPVLITVHPSALLRIPDAGQRERAYRAFVADLSKAFQQAQEPPSQPPLQNKEPGRSRLAVD